MDKNTDAELIQKLGGPTKVARLLNTTQQRVQNWISRGIPAVVKLAHPELFLPGFKTSKKPRRDMCAR